jgi:hypothetical protein
MRVFVTLRTASTLLEEYDIEFEEALRVESVASTLDEDSERLNEEI